MKRDAKAKLKKESGTQRQFSISKEMHRLKFFQKMTGTFFCFDFVRGLVTTEP